MAFDIWCWVSGGMPELRTERGELRGVGEPERVWPPLLELAVPSNSWYSKHISEEEALK